MPQSAHRERCILAAHAEWLVGEFRSNKSFKQHKRPESLEALETAQSAPHACLGGSSSERDYGSQQSAEPPERSCRSSEPLRWTLDRNREKFFGVV